jgi:hypothetical protein
MGIVHPLAFASPGLLPPGALTVPHDQARRAGINRRSPDLVVLAPERLWSGPGSTGKSRISASHIAVSGRIRTPSPATGTGEGYGRSEGWG